MATSLTTIWTLLPNGRTGDGKLRLSAMVSFRPATVDGKPTSLARFPTLLNWPTTVRQAQWQVQFSNETTPRVAQVENPAVFDPLMWNSLFNASTLVRPYVFEDRSTNCIFSFGASDVSNVIRSLYKNVADGGTVDSFSNLQTDINMAVNAGQNAAKATHGCSPGRTDAGYFGEDGKFFVNVPPEIRQFARGNLFYDRGKAANQVVIPPGWDYDFLQMIAALSSQPHMLRKIGIVIDLIIDPPLPALAQTKIRLATFNSSVELQTAVTLSSTDFRAIAPAGSDISNEGLLKLDEPKYAVEHLEVDGALMKMSDYALAPRTLPYDDNVPLLPAMRSGGFTVMRIGRDVYVAGRLDRQTTLNGQLSQPQQIVLTADDILRGYRVDVFYNGKWFSLCYRTGTMQIANRATISLPSKSALEEATQPTDPAEGYITTTSAAKQKIKKEDGTEDEILKIHEAVFGWDGWSLTAARPGLSIPADPNEIAPRRIANVTPAGYNFSVRTDVKAEPGTLPKLRFGTEYRFRARAVDLAGNSVPFEAAPDLHASKPLVYTRFDPVVAPVLVPCAPFTEGESCEHLVIRSNGVDSADSYVDFLNGYAKPGASYSADCTRWVAPPKASYDTAETHGMFDAILTPTLRLKPGAQAPPDAASIERAYTIAKKELGTFLDTSALNSSYDPAVVVIQKDRAVVTPPGSRDTKDILPRGAALKQGQYVIHPNLPTLPYLPDPLAFGFVFLDSGGDSTKYQNSNILTLYDWTGPWPDFRVGYITLRDGESGFTSDNKGVSIFMRKGTMLTVAYASIMDQGDLIKMANFDNTTQNAQAIAAGKHPLFTPCRKLTFVHAVQRPTTRPLVFNFQVNRADLGETFVVIQGRIEGEQVNNPIGNSTGSVTVEATWFDKVEASNGAKDVSFSASPFQLKVEYDDSFVELLSQDLKPLKHDFGDTKTRTVNYKFTSTTRYREYFPVQITADPRNLNVTGSEFNVIVPSSAKPPVPEILYVVPTFRWNAAFPGGQKRTGGGLRVYVKPPWYVSGTGEMLAVILENTPGAATTMGHDPIWTSVRGAVQLVVDDFITEDSKTKPVIKPYGSTIALGYTPQFNTERKLWYFDIEVKQSKSVVPLMRFAFARLQQNSLNGLELSEKVFADFVPLYTDRTCTIVRKSGKISVAVQGTFARNSFQFGNTVSGRSLVAQKEVINITNPEDDDLGWRPQGNSVELSVLSSDPQDEATTFLFGEIPEPPLSSMPTTYRLSIRELEYFASDSDTQEGTGVIFYNNPPQPYRTRIVYACHIPL